MLDKPVDAIARRADRLADVMLDAVDGDAVDELTTLLTCPPRAHAAGAKRGLPGDAGAAKEW